jgi:DMSO/TMAO reductase YedYZ heme-binding membrane subunit
METSVLDISSTLGLCGMVVLSLNFLLGLLLSTSYKRSVYWKKLPQKIKKLDVLQIHNWTAYLALALIFVHPFILLFDKSTKFFTADILIPFHSSYQQFFVALGIVSFYAVLIVIVSTQKSIKRNLGFRLWKNIHLISYATALLMCVHGLFLDPQLKNREPDYFDGEKLLCEICLLVLVSAAIVRFIYYKRKQIAMK